MSMKNYLAVGAVFAPVLGVFAITTNVSTVAELAGAIPYLNERHQKADELVLAPGTYVLDELNLQYWHTTNKGWADSLAHIGVTAFTMRGATGNPADVVLCLTNSASDVGMLYSYTATIRDLTISNCTCSTRSACCNVNANSHYSNVVVAACSSRDGGGANSGDWRDCRFVNCTATRYGGAVTASNAKLFGCTFENCSSVTDGGASHSAILTDCTIRNCSSATGGGACMGVLTNCWVEGCSATTAGGIASATIHGCTVTNCTATDHAGGIRDAVGVVSDCTIVGNVSGNRGGGAYLCSLSNCTVACNFAATYGGGVCGNTGDKAACTLTDCLVRGNVVSNDVDATYGGGVAYATIRGGRVTMNHVIMNNTAKDKYGYGGGTAYCIAEDAMIDGNAQTGECKNFVGGGDANSTLTRCTVMNNISQNLGGGIAGATARECVISNNVGLGSAGTVRTSRIYDSRIYECSLDVQGPVVNTRIMNYTNGNVIARGANVLTPDADTHFVGTTHLVNSYGFFTNCLFTGQHMTVQYCALFSPTKNQETILSSCTVASNRVEFTHAGFTDASGARFTAVNCVFSDNYTGNGQTPSDLRSSYNHLQFDHCLIGRINTPQLSALVYPCTGCITNRPAKFAFAGDEPFLLRFGSPALGAGLVQDWMADATDIRGGAQFARLTGGRVDMGCFEGFVPSAGTMVIVR